MMDAAEIACTCGRVFRRLESGGIDFLQGREFPDFEFNPLDREQQEQLTEESQGVVWRMQTLVLPLLEESRMRQRLRRDELRVLDCGCGSGASVDALRAEEFAAVGVDAGRSRHLQWRERVCREYLHSASALSLPFENRTFHAVVSSGLIEHIGIHEEEHPHYRAKRLPDCHRQRQRFVDELTRVVRREGMILLDHPNGSFPVDFWHGGRHGGIRWHRSSGDMLPTFSEVAGYFRNSDASLHLGLLSPARRLRFRQVHHHWYGKVFRPLMSVWLALLGSGRLEFMLRSRLNPYLIILASRRTGE